LKKIKYAISTAALCCALFFTLREVHAEPFHNMSEGSEQQARVALTYAGGMLAANTCTNWTTHEILCGMAIAVAPTVALEKWESNTHPGYAGIAKHEIKQAIIGAFFGSMIGWDMAANKDQILFRWSKRF
jgi:hypothetical protein